MGNEECPRRISLRCDRFCRTEHHFDSMGGMTMEIDVTQVLMDFDDNPIRVGGRCATCGQATDVEDVTLRQVCLTALNHPANNRQVGFEAQVKRYELAELIHREDTPDLCASDIAELKELIAGVFTPLVTGRAGGMLEDRRQS